MTAPAVRDDPFVQQLMAKLPKGSADTFSDEQLLALKAALWGRSWGAHSFDLRWTLSIWRWHYYFVVLGGRNRRELTRREREIQRLALASVLALFITVSTLFGLLLLYLLKSAMGINLIPGFSLGVWDWFKAVFLGL